MRVYISDDAIYGVETGEELFTATADALETALEAGHIVEPEPYALDLYYKARPFEAAEIGCKAVQLRRLHRPQDCVADFATEYEAKQFALKKGLNIVDTWED